MRRTSISALLDFLTEAFAGHVRELRAFLRSLPEGEVLTNSLVPELVPFNVFLDDFVAKVEARAFIDRIFFERLHAHFPRRSSTVIHLASMWGYELSPLAGKRSKLRRGIAVLFAAAVLPWIVMRPVSPVEAFALPRVEEAWPSVVPGALVPFLVARPIRSRAVPSRPHERYDPGEAIRVELRRAGQQSLSQCWKGIYNTAWSPAEVAAMEFRLSSDVAERGFRFVLINEQLRGAETACFTERVPDLLRAAKIAGPLDIRVRLSEIMPGVSGGAPTDARRTDGRARVAR